MMTAEGDNLDDELMQECINLFKIKLPMLSMGMFWACPKKWIATDAKNLGFAATKGVTFKPVTAADYLNWLPKIREAVGGDGVEFSLQAELWALSQKNQKSTGAEDMPKDFPWWQKFFDSEEQAHAAFDLIRDACDALGVSNSRGLSAQRVSFTNIKEKGVEWLRLNCANILVLQIAAVESSMQNASFIMRADEEQGGFVPGGRFAKPCNGHKMGFCSASLGDLIEKDSIARSMFLKALGDVAATYSKITKRNFPDAHRPMLLSAAFHPESREYLFEHGPHKKPFEGIGDLLTDTVASGYTKANALRDLFMSEKQVDLIIDLLKRKKNIILQGAPGTGKTFVARRLAYLLMGVADESRAPVVQFHQSTSYEDFIQGYRPDGKGGFELKDGTFYSFCQDAHAEPDRSFVFIIDEINRGNLSKIFGELMMLIESDKRDPSYAVPLTYAASRDETFHVPENVFLIGTMNTADRSLSLVDYALRRRFAFIETEPGFDSLVFAQVLSGHGASPALIQAIRTRMEALNQLIEADATNLGRGYRIGHSFFVPSAGTTPDDSWLQAVFRYEIIPLLEEYWADDRKALAKALAIVNGGGTDEPVE